MKGKRWFVRNWHLQPLRKSTGGTRGFRCCVLLANLFKQTFFPQRSSSKECDSDNGKNSCNLQTFFLLYANSQLSSCMSAAWAAAAAENFPPELQSEVADLPRRFGLAIVSHQSRKFWFYTPTVSTANTWKLPKWQVSLLTKESSSGAELAGLWQVRLPSDSRTHAEMCFSTMSAWTGFALGLALKQIRRYWHSAACLGCLSLDRHSDAELEIRSDDFTELVCGLL